MALNPATLLRQLGPPVVVLVAILAIWEFLVGSTGTQFLLPPPSAIAGALAENGPELFAAARHTMLEAMGGLLLGTFAGVVTALVVARWSIAGRALLPLAIAASAIPTIALAPIANVWFGSTNVLSKMSVVAVVVFFPVLINVVRGLRQVDPLSLELMHSYAATEVQVYETVRIPNALPYLMTALRISATLALITAIIAEYFGGPRLALGVWVLDRARRFRFDEAWAAITIAALLGVGLYLILTILEQRLIPWYSSVQATDE